ncbi:MAG: DUF6776 family protein [Gammaproteobacteria bacterium]
MRWKLLRRRLSVSAPRMIVRSHLPWPLRWALAAVVLGFSAAIALWAFELGKDIAGLDRDLHTEVRELRRELARSRSELDAVQSVANTAESLLRAERTALEAMQQRLRQAESENLALKADLGFFETLLPAQGDALAVRGLQVEAAGPGQLRYQLLVMQSGKSPAPFTGSYEVSLVGTRAGQAWSQGMPEGGLPLQLRQYMRVDGLVDHPPDAVVQTVQIRILDQGGAVRAMQWASL